MKLHAIAYGCQMSVADGEEMSRPLFDRGFSWTDDVSQADAVILNTCTVRQHAEDRAVSMIGRLRAWKEERPDRFLIVAGCAAERIGARLRSRFPHVDLVVGAKSIEDYPALLEAALSGRFDAPAREAGGVLRADGLSCGPGSAFVTIMRGCNYSCAYCIVPSVRGREIHRPWDTILQETRDRVAEGAVEVTLLGQTVNAYREPGGNRDFADLLRAVGSVDGLRRLRFTSPHPYYLSDKLMSAMAETATVCPHLHLPAQSGSDRILASMRRNYTASLFLERITRLRGLVPELALSTDLIVGFPGETEDDFKRTLEFAETADFCAAYCYKFSPRAATPAADMDGQVPREVKEERLAGLLRLTDALTEKHLETLIRRDVRILLGDETDGRTQYHFKARLSAPRRAGTIVNAVVTGRTRTALKCEPRA